MTNNGRLLDARVAATRPGNDYGRIASQEWYHWAGNELKHTLCLVRTSATPMMLSARYMGAIKTPEGTRETPNWNVIHSGTRGAMASRECDVIDLSSTEHNLSSGIEDNCNRLSWRVGSPASITLRQRVSKQALWPAKDRNDEWH